MSEYAHDFSPTSPPEPFELTNPAVPAVPAPPPEPQRCALCSAPLPAEADRCVACGLWLGGHGKTVARSTLLRVGAVFASLYVTALLIVALAR